jgi:hypothetical protein
MTKFEREIEENDLLLQGHHDMSEYMPVVSKWREDDRFPSGLLHG